MQNKSVVHKKAIFLISISIENTNNKLNVSKCCCPLYKINGIKINRLVVYEEDQGQHDTTVTRQGGGG